MVRISLGQKKELKQSLAALNNVKNQGALIQDGIKWSFTTPATSHQGDVWECFICSVRSIQTSILGEQELSLFCAVEAVPNDRPIVYVFDDPNDLEALTPNHVLLLKGAPILPPGLFELSDLYVLRRWKQVQYMAELFWKRWKSEYLLVMQEKQKWTRPRKSFSPGDVVLIADATAPRGSWMMGRVLSTKSDSKGLVRSVCVQTKISSLGETNNKNLPAPGGHSLGL